MNKYLSTELWRPSEGFLSTETVENIIKENKKNLSVLAGPGTGKTEILAQRASFLLQTGICKRPQKILALSFKVDAATNLKNRINLRCTKDQTLRFNSSTFDAFFISLIRRFSSLLPNWVKLPSDFDISFFTHDWWQEYEHLILNGQPCQYKKNYIPIDFKIKPESEVLKIWNYCTEKKVVDYDMCRSMALAIIKNNNQVKELISSTYKYLFLDEFQDTTNLQYEFIKEIFKDSDTIITAVGDLNQTIMGWAGANLKNFENLQQDFNTEITALNINHRSNSNIIKLINYIIRDLTPTEETPIIYEGTRKEAPLEKPLGARTFNSIEEEGEYIAKYINILIDQNPDLVPSDFALILRQRAQDYYDEVNEIFNQNNLSLRNEDALVINNGVKVQDLMSEPLSVLFIHLIRKKSDIIDYTQEKELENTVASLTGYDLHIDRDYKKIKDYLSKLINIIDFSRSVKMFIAELIKLIGIENIQNTFPQYRSKHLNKVTSSFCVLFQKSIDNHRCNIEKAIYDYEGKNQIKLMTIHKSKGLEFNTVFFVDFHDQSWWGIRQAISQNNIEAQREEKNSFFVGLSRAEERLFFTKSKNNWPPIIINLLKKSKMISKLPDLVE